VVGDQPTHRWIKAKGPFDALLLAQAGSEKLTFLTADQKLLAVWPDAVDARL